MRKGKPLKDPDRDAKQIAQLDLPAPVSGKDRRTPEIGRARRVTALQYRVAGLTYQQIADQMKVTERAARQMVTDALGKAEKAPNVRELREIENQRLDSLQTAVWSRAIRGDKEAIDRVLKIMDRRAKLNGLDAPSQVNISVGVRAEMEAALSELQQLILPEQDVVEAEVIEDDDYDPDADAGGADRELAGDGAAGDD